MKESPDLIRLRNEYQNRRLRYDGSDRYSYFNRPNLFMIQGREQVILKSLAKHGYNSLENQKVLEIGCGSGGVLRQFFNWGVSAQNLHGIDLLFDRLVEAKTRLSESQNVNANGEWLPYPQDSFDIVMQFTALSSILDPEVKTRIAKEMLRVLNQNGLILWYDFWLNPTNKQTKGIQPEEIRALFPDCQYDFHKITLAPPITRRIVRFSWVFASLLENVKVFNTHYLVLIHKMGYSRKIN